MRWHLFSDGEPGARNDPEDGSDAAFWASPVGEAARAKLRGDRFFQIELDDASLTAYAENAARSGGRRARRTCDLLGQIEELGWHLEHVSWWRVDGNDATAPEHPQRSRPDADQVCGVYLFHAPTHRRDVS
jgi:hypothetical protein